MQKGCELSSLTISEASQVWQRMAGLWRGCWGAGSEEAAAERQATG